MPPTDRQPTPSSRAGQQPTPAKDADRVIDATASTPDRSPSDTPPPLALQTRPVKTDAVALLREPDVALADIRKAAATLTVFLDSKKSKVIFGADRYTEIDDWQAIGNFFGLRSRLVGDAWVKYGAVSGFEATYEILNRDGEVVARETSMCCNDEDKWSSRPTYITEIQLARGRGDEKRPSGEWLREDEAEARKAEWYWKPHPTKPGKSVPDKRRVRGPDMPVPLFQMRSMAHTRSQAKAFGACLRFVPALLGLKTTPAEELSAATRVYTDGRQEDAFGPELPDSWRQFADQPDAPPAAKPRGVAKGRSGTPNPTDPDDALPIEGEVVQPRHGDVILEVGDAQHGATTSGKQFTRWAVKFLRGDDGSEVTGYVWATDRAGQMIHAHVTDEPPVVRFARACQASGQMVDVQRKLSGTRIDIEELVRLDGDQ